jgi:hypothetical protein
MKELLATLAVVTLLIMVYKSIGFEYAVLVGLAHSIVSPYFKTNEK